MSVAVWYVKLSCLLRAMRHSICTTDIYQPGSRHAGLFVLNFICFSNAQEQYLCRIQQIHFGEILLWSFAHPDLVPKTLCTVRQFDLWQWYRLSGTLLREERRALHVMQWQTEGSTLVQDHGSVMVQIYAYSNETAFHWRELMCLIYPMWWPLGNRWRSFFLVKT